MKKDASQPEPKMERESFVFFTNWIKGIQNFSERKKMEIIYALVNYCIYGIEPTSQAPHVQLAFHFAKSSIDKNIKRYLKQKKEQTSGDTSGEHDVNTMLTSGEHQDDMTEGVNVNVNDKEKEIYKEKEKPVGEQGLTPQSPINDIDPESPLGKLRAWMATNTPYILRHVEHQYTEAQYTKLLTFYTVDEICTVLLNMENRKDLRKKYSNLYLTSLNWLKNEHKKRDIDGYQATTN